MVTGTNRVRHGRYKTKTAFVNQVEYPLDVHGVTLTKSVNKVFADAIDYRNYCFIKRPAEYKNDVANELNKITKKTVVQMKDWTFNDEDPV